MTTDTLTPEEIVAIAMVDPWDRTLHSSSKCLEIARDGIAALESHGYQIVEQREIDQLNEMALDFLRQEIERADAMGVPVKEEIRARAFPATPTKNGGEG